MRGWGKGAGRALAVFVVMRRWSRRRCCRGRFGSSLEPIDTVMLVHRQPDVACRHLCLSLSRCLSVCLSVCFLSTATASEFSVTGASGEEYLVDFSSESGTEIVMTESDEAPEETTVIVTGGAVTTIKVGSETYTVSYDEGGEVDSVTSGAGSATTRRTQQVDFAERRLATCEEECVQNADASCLALETACDDSTLGPLLGALCNDLTVLCNERGIEEGCERNCAVGEYRAPDLQFSPTNRFTERGVQRKRMQLPLAFT